jgi:hypothetical protein
MRWETNTTSYTTSGIHNSFCDNFKFNLVGATNDCFDAQVNMVTPQSEPRIILVEAGNALAIDKFPISVIPAGCSVKTELVWSKTATWEDWSSG